MQQPHSDAGKHDKPFYCANRRIDSRLLLEFTETVLNPKTAALKPNYCFRGQLKAGADRDIFTS